MTGLQNRRHLQKFSKVYLKRPDTIGGLPNLNITTISYCSIKKSENLNEIFPAISKCTLSALLQKIHPVRALFMWSAHARAKIIIRCSNFLLMMFKKISASSSALPQLMVRLWGCVHGLKMMLFHGSRRQDATTAFTELQIARQPHNILKVEVIYTSGW